MDTGRGLSRTTSYSLKLIATLSMLVDHIAVALMRVFVRRASLRWLYFPLRCIGRTALPLYAFLLCEGFRHTRDRGKYLRNVALFAVLSELPSDLFFRSWARRAEGMSIFSTLTLALLALLVSDWCAERLRGRGAAYVALCRCLVAALALALSHALRVEYGWQGTALVLLVDAAQRALPPKRMETLPVSVPPYASAAAAVLAWLAAWDVADGTVVELWGAPAALLILLYRGEKGSFRIPKWAFYVFYPAHMCALIALRELLLK